MSAKIKMCGLTRPEDIDTVNALGVEMVGFMFYKPSPRHLTAEQASILASKCNPNVERISVLADPDEEMLEAALASVSPHRIQLSGSESPERVADIKRRSHSAIIKAVSIGSAEDFARTKDYEGLADWFLFDAKPPEGGMTGGNGEAFDWTLLKAYDGKQPYLLAGGLNPDNVAEAIRASNAPMVALSSGVETAPGQKDAGLMTRFVESVRTV